MREKVALIVLLVWSFKSSAFIYEMIKETPDKSLMANHIERRTLPLSRLETTGATEGDVLFFNGLEWLPAPLTGLQFKGTWNPDQSGNVVISNDGYTKNNLAVDAVSGEYFVVSHNSVGPVFEENWNKGDWIIFNGETWERINNTGTVLDIFGDKPHVVSKRNDYKWQQLDMSNSKIFDLSDVRKPVVELDLLEGYILKWNKISKKWQLMQDDQGISSDVDTSQIENGSIVKSVIDLNNKIPLSKINGFTLDGNGKIPLEGGGSISNLGLDNNNLNADNLTVVIKDTVNGDVTISLADFISAYNQLKIDIGSKESSFEGSGNEGDFLSGEVDQNTGERMWYGLTLNFVNEVTPKLFMTDENVWNALIEGYDLANAVDGKVGINDSVLSGLQKLEKQLNGVQNTVTLGTDQILNGNISVDTHFNPEISTESGFMYFNNATGEWSLKTAGGLQYKGNIEAAALPNDGNLGGDYYVISEGNDDYNSGDWAIYNSTTSAWERINNSGIVFEFNGRSGNVVTCPSPTCADVIDYNFGLIDKTGSKLEDIEKIKVEDAVVNGLLKYVEDENGNRFWTAVEDLSGSNGQPVDATTLEGGILNNSHVNNINIEHVKNLKTDLDGKLNTSGGILQGNIDLGGTLDLLNLSLINTVNFGNIIDTAVNFSVVNFQNSLVGNGDASNYFAGDGTLQSFSTDNVSVVGPNFYLSNDNLFNEITVVDVNPYVLTNPDDPIQIGENDNLAVSIKKIIKQLNNSQSLPDNAIQGPELEEGSVGIEKFADGTKAGQTLIFKNNLSELDNTIVFTKMAVWDAETDNGVLPAPFILQNLNVGDYFEIRINSSFYMMNGMKFSNGDLAIVYDEEGTKKLRPAGWRHRSSAGLNYLASWNIQALLGELPPSNPKETINEGDYFKIQIPNNAVEDFYELDGTKFFNDDLAVATYQSGSLKFNRIGRKQFLTLFNGRAGDLHLCPNDLIPQCFDSNNNRIFDYSWENLKGGSALVPGGDVTAVFEEFIDIKTNHALGQGDAGKVLKWETDKFVPGEDLSGTDVSALTEASFAKSEGDPNARAVTAEDVNPVGGIDFNEVAGTEGLYVDYINLNPPNASVNFNFPLSFGNDTNGIQYSMNNLGPITGVLNGTLYSFTMDSLVQKCQSDLDLELYEASFVGPKDKTYFLNGNKEFVQISPENISGLDNELFEADKVLSLKLVGFDSTVDEEQELIISSDAPVEIEGTTLLDSFEVLERKLKGATGGISAGHIIVEEDYVVSATEVGKTLFLTGEDITVSMADDLPEGFQITIKRLDPINPMGAITNKVVANNNSLEGASEIILAKNYASLTLVKHGSDLIILQRSGELN